MFPPIKVVGGGHENLGLGAYGPPLFWHQGSQGTKELLVCAVSSSLLAGQDSSRVATWSCSETRTMFILWVKGVIHPLNSDDVKFLGNSSAKPGSSKTPAGPEHVSGGAVQGGGTLSIIRLKYRKLPHDTFHITIY